MRTSNTFSVLFWIDPKRAVNNYAMIYARVTVNQKRVLISLKRKISLDLWDAERKKAHGNSGEASLINQSLDQTQSRLFQCYQELLSQRKKVTANLVKAAYLGEDDHSKSL